MTWPIAPKPTTATRMSTLSDGRSPSSHGLWTREALLQRFKLRLLHREGVVVVGERPRAHFAVERLERVDDLRTDVRVALRELRLEVAVQPEHVVEHKHLTVARETGADADRRDGETLCHDLRDGRGDRLEHDGERTGIFE